MNMEKFIKNNEIDRLRDRLRGLYMKIIFKWSKCF